MPGRAVQFLGQFGLAGFPAHPESISPGSVRHFPTPSPRLAVSSRYHDADREPLVLLPRCEHGLTQVDVRKIRNRVELTWSRCGSLHRHPLPVLYMPRGHPHHRLMSRLRLPAQTYHPHQQTIGRHPLANSSKLIF